MKLTGEKNFQCFSFQLGCLVPLLWGGVRTSDTIYNPLPLYHSSAGMLSIGPCFYAGVKVAMRNKFSANNFWKDCVKYNATVRNKPLLWLKFFNNFVKLTINLLSVMGMWYDKSITFHFWNAVTKGLYSGYCYYPEVLDYSAVIRMWCSGHP